MSSSEKAADGIEWVSAVKPLEPLPAALPSPKNGFRIMAFRGAEREARPVYFAARAMKAAVLHALGNPAVEVGGFLAGGFFSDRGRLYTRIDAYIEGRHVESGAASARFTHSTFEDAWKRLPAAAQGHAPPMLAGWCHTHPGFGAFLSGPDMFIQKSFFDLEFQVALVIDPIARELKLFRWASGEVRQGGFFLFKKARAEP